MQLTKVESSNINAIGYDEAEQILRVQFHSGDVYDYVKVPPGIHAQLMNAPSKGKFLGTYIKGAYQFVPQGTAPITGPTSTVIMLGDKQYKVTFEEIK